MKKCKLRWTEDEVVGYLEYAIQNNMATDNELSLYLDYRWSGLLDKSLYTYRKVLKKLKKYHNNLL